MRKLTGCLTALLLLSLAPAPADARIVMLRNDSAEPGAEIAFYPTAQGEDAFASIFEVPEDIGEFIPCRILLWVGPEDFIVVIARLDIVDELGGAAEFVWNGGLDAYRIAGSRRELNSIDLTEEGLRTAGRFIKVQIEHVPGADGPPTLASDTDGITPGHNTMFVLTRRGYWFGWTEDRPPDDAVYPQPQGDWVLRLQIAEPGDRCPGVEDPIVDQGVRPDRALAQDMAVGPPPDMRIDPDRGPEPDVREPPDARAPRPDARIPPDVEPIVETDFGPRPGTFAVDRMVPNRGTGLQNLDVVISGRGFPAGESVLVHLGEHRLLEAQARSDSTITAIVPAGIPVGVYNLEVERTDGQVAILPEAFRVEGPNMLTIKSLTPQVIVEGEPSDLTITGAGFDADTTFEIGTARLQNLVVEDPTLARGRLEATLVAGTYDLVARRDGQEATLTAALAVRRPGSKSSDDCGGCDTAQRGLGWAPLLMLLLGLRRRRQ